MLRNLPKGSIVIGSQIILPNLSESPFLLTKMKVLGQMIAEFISIQNSLVCEVLQTGTPTPTKTIAGWFDFM